MSHKYISLSNTFTLDYPDDWLLEPEPGGIIAIFRKGGLFKKNSRNILRITPRISDRVISPAIYKAALNLRRKEIQDLEEIESSPNFLMNFHIIRYRKETYQDIGERTFLMMEDYWDLIIGNRVFNCFFSIRHDEQDSPQSIEERSIAEQILFTLRLL